MSDCERCARFARRVEDLLRTNNIELERRRRAEEALVTEQRRERLELAGAKAFLRRCTDLIQAAGPLPWAHSQALEEAERWEREAVQLLRDIGEIA